MRNAGDGPSAGLTPKQRERAELELGKPRGKDGGKRDCVKVKSTFFTEKHYCFDSASGHLAEIRGGELGLRYEFGDYEASGTKTFPRSIRVYYRKGGPLVDIRIARIDPLPSPSPKLFLPVPGSQEEGVPPACKETTPAGGTVKEAKLVKKALPVYPAMARLRGISGRVVFHAVIGKDGVPHALWAVESPSPILTEAALEAVRQWRYQPTLLCGEPVKVDTAIAVVFTL